jgi:DNA-binding MarR family transcriptional regulator
MPDDFIEQLGRPFLAHRLRRVADLILEGTSEALHELGFEGPARSASTLLLLSQHGPMGITEIGFRLRLSHPMIIKLARSLAAANLITDEVDPFDQRRRLIQLSAKGREQAGRLETFGTIAAKTFEAMYRESGADLFDALERFESAAVRVPVSTRLIAAIASEGATGVVGEGEAT